MAEAKTVVMHDGTAQPTSGREAPPVEPYPVAIPFWLTLHSNPHKEYAVRDFLIGRGYDAYLPEEPNKIRRRDRPPRRPFFPLYLFLRFPGSERLEELQWTPGLRRVVMFGNLPALVHQEIIDDIRERLAVMEAAREGPFRTGDRVTITRGPFKGLDAVFDRRLSRADRVRVFLDFASRLEVPIELDLDVLRAKS
jgi:transcriptional antiterminator RfaH